MSDTVRNWIQCDACNKWRVLLDEPENLPEQWVCSMNISDPHHDSCDKAEEAQDEGVDESNDNVQDDDEEEADAELQQEQGVLLKQEKKRAREEEKNRRTQEKNILKEAKAVQELEEYIAGLSEEQKIEHKAKATKKNSKGQIPIHLYPKQFADKKATKLLRIDLHFGAEVGAQDKQDRTPLHYAVMNSCEEYEQLLLAKGAFPFACDISDRCPDEYRVFKKQKKCMWDKFI